MRSRDRDHPGQHSETPTLLKIQKLALSLLARQETQMRNGIYQNWLALDYLLAADGVICGKFKLTNCCQHITGQGHAVKNITKLGRARGSGALFPAVE